MKTNVSTRELREFGFLLGIGFPIFIGWLLPFLFGHEFRIWTLYIGFPSLFLGILKPRSLFYPFKLWMKLGLALGWVNSRIILGLVYILVVLPISFVMRTFGYDPLRIKQNNKKTYREYKHSNKIDLTKIF